MTFSCEKQRCSRYPLRIVARSEPVRKKWKMCPTPSREIQKRSMCLQLMMPCSGASHKHAALGPPALARSWNNRWTQNTVRVRAE